MPLSIGNRSPGDLQVFILFGIRVFVAYSLDRYAPLPLSHGSTRRSIVSVATTITPNSSSRYKSCPPTSNNAFLLPITILLPMQTILYPPMITNRLQKFRRRDPIRVNTAHKESRITRLHRASGRYNASSTRAESHNPAHSAARGHIWRSQCCTRFF